MSDTSFENTASPPVNRLVGKWQIPAFLASAIAFGFVVANVKSPERKLGLESNLERIVRLLDAGLFDAARESSEELLTWDDIDESARGTLQLYLARATFGKAERIEDTGEASASEVIELYGHAQQSGAGLIDRDYVAIAKCHERLGQYESAIKYYESAVEAAPKPALELRRRIIELSEYPLRRPEGEVALLLDAFIADAQDAPQQLWWALSRRVEQLSAADHHAEADALLDEYRDRFSTSEERWEYSYLLALNAWSAGRYDEAERMLRELLNGMTVSDTVHSRAAWLLGRVVMHDGRAQRPEEAIAILNEVISGQVDRVYVAASRLAMAEAQAELLRFDEALASYRQAIDDLARVGGHRLINPDAVRASLVVVAEQARSRGRLDVAIDFLELAVSLIDPGADDVLSKHLMLLADAQAAAARAAIAQADKASESSDKDGEDARLKASQLFKQAGENYVQVAWMSTLNERRSSSAMWTAAGLFDEGGHYGRAIDLLRAFVRDRPDAEIVPRVLLRLGRSLQVSGRFREAIDVYQRDVSAFPRSPFASSALIPLAQCYMALGAEGETEAENALKRIIENSDVFTPDAVEYRDAMFLLGDLYTRQGHYEDAIPVLDEALRNYSDDVRVPRAMFLIADAYRKSAMAMKEEMLLPEFVGESKRLKAEHASRLAEAAKRFRVLTDRLVAHEASLGELDALYLQDARLYEAACLFELGRYEDSLGLYERAAWIYKDSPAALGAYVQVINCYIFLGREPEAEASLRRAQYLVETIDEKLFDAAGEFESREGWRRYFNWVGDILVSR